MKYFVLKPKGSDPFAAASRAAMLRYADMIQGHEPRLAEDLREWALRENAEAHPNLGLHDERGQY